MTDSAAQTIRAARLRAGLSQTELAEAAGITQSVVSAYEAARREPSFDMLVRLVRAAGFDLDLELVAAPDRSPLQLVVDRQRSKLVRALHRMGAREVRLFGSVARGEDGPTSDVDLLVDVRPDVGVLELERMRGEAERILGVAVDIVPSNSLKAELASSVLADAQQL